MKLLLKILYSVASNSVQDTTVVTDATISNEESHTAQETHEHEAIRIAGDDDGHEVSFWCGF